MRPTDHCFREDNCSEHPTHVGDRCCCCDALPGDHTGCDCPEAWTYEPAEPDVGIMSGGWIHEACTAEYDQGVTDESALQGLPRDGHVDEHHQLTCHDCGASTEFVDAAFVGFD